MARRYHHVHCQKLRGGHKLSIILLYCDDRRSMNIHGSADFENDNKECMWYLMMGGSKFGDCPRYTNKSIIWAVND